MFNSERTARALPVAIGAWIVLAIHAAAAVEQTLVEHVTQNPPGLAEGLGTSVYPPSKKERPFFEKLAPDEIKTGGLAGDYDITKRSGRYVGWFGIVREIEENGASRQTVLTVEHKYFDGLTDTHIQAVSFNGSGDFLAVLRGLEHKIPLLSLVKVYGTVAPAAAGDLPRVNAEFVRVWHWGNFTFLAAWGKQRGSEQWRKLNQIDLDDIYEPHPSRTYYEERLGKRQGSDPERRRLLKAAGPMVPALETRVKQLIDVVLAAEAHRLGGALQPVLDLRGEEAAIAVLTECLKNPDDWIRRAASEGLGRVGPKAIPSLISALDADAAPVRASAAISLLPYGPDAKDAVPALTVALTDEDSDVRRKSALALGRVGQAAQPAVSRLKEVLSDPDTYVRLSAAEALWRVTVEPQPSVRVLVKLLEDKNQHVRCEAAERLDEIGPEAKDAVLALATALKDEYEYFRSSAADALGNIGPEAKAAVPALVTALGDESRYVRGNAAEALGLIGAEAETVVPALIAATSDADDYVRGQAVGALGEFGPAATDATATLVRILKEDPDDFVRGVCGRELAKIDVTGKIAVPVLVENLRDVNTRVRRFAAMALADLGPAAADAVEPLAVALKDPEPVVRLHAAGALWRIDQQDAAAVPVLVEALGSNRWDLRLWAAQNFLGTGREAVRAVPALVENLKSDHVYVRSAAAAALGRIGPAAEAGVEPLTESLHDEREYVRSHAAEALWRIRGSDESLRLLIESLSSRDRTAQCHAAKALGKIGPEAQAAEPTLTLLLKHHDRFVRRAAAEAIQHISPTVTDGR